MAHQWRGVIREYMDRLPFTASDPVVTLGEGGTPLIEAPALAKLLDVGSVHLKFEGMNPTGSFKDRGMTTAVSKALGDGAKAVIAASTGNTSAAAAAYAVKAGMQSVVLVPAGKISWGKLSQAVAHKAQILQVRGNFDDCLRLARELSENYPVFLVNSVNPNRLQGQKTAAFEVVDVLGDAPDLHAMPLGNAGNISAYHLGYREEVADKRIKKQPMLYGIQAAGSAPFIQGSPVAKPETIATAIRIGNPASWDLAQEAKRDSGGAFGSVSDKEILWMHRFLSQETGVFVEPSSATGAAGLHKLRQLGELPKVNSIVITVTGHGLKDPDWALKDQNGRKIKPKKVAAAASSVAEILGLERK
ncbi:threonine synthase [Aquiluna sp.]|jgi:threonine synthase|uniref:threonine synthase n=1 Tax=Aquiluna sp. TaxID=2053504 RepID=UPI001DA770E5|nr:threonine synthase [Aquiluna sp.]MDA2986056.1 threonine synthase [Actinomycetota bacterium]MDA8796498.1 threonine synthase [Aquiluna sp.]NCV35684.1 threonine synthase [Actinomycetota bacterium]NCV98102.1 threonine synthase [Actinomycetota bacterium]